MKKNFFWKSFVSFSLVWSLLILLISGIVLYIAPPGRVSNWTNWMLFGFSKAGWQAIHTVFSFTFVFLSVFHLVVFNWKVFWLYLVTKAANGLNKQKELLVSLALIIVVFFGTYFNIQPFKAVIDFGEWTTESWEVKEEIAPIPHAELLTIKELSDRYIPLSADSILLMIKGKGLKADSTGQTIQKISELNNMTPAKLYSFITPANKTGVNKSTHIPQMQGLGRKTIREIAAERVIDVNDLIEVLRKNNIKANPDDMLRTVAENAGKTPLEIWEIIAD
jgi:hypothetical protein